MNATYSFVSKSIAKPGRLDDLAAAASRTTQAMDKEVSGVIARQVSVDREHNTVIVWATFDKKESLYNYLATQAGNDAHEKDEKGEDVDMEAMIESFEMFDLSPVAQRLEPKS